MKKIVRIIAQELERDYWRLPWEGEKNGMRIIRWHVHQKHNNVSIKIELVTTSEALRWKLIGGPRSWKMSKHLSTTKPGERAPVIVTKMKFPHDISRTHEDYPIKEWALRNEMPCWIEGDWEQGGRRLLWKEGMKLQGKESSAMMRLYVASLHRHFSPCLSFHTTHPPFLLIRLIT